MTKTKNDAAGTAANCMYDLPEAVYLRARKAKSIHVDQIAARVESQLAAPMGFPPLAQATIPGDRVVLTVEPELPQRTAVLDGVLNSLLSAGGEDSLTTVLISGAPEQGERLKTELVELGHSRCQVKVHDPSNEKEMALLGVSDHGEAIRLNRELCDADFVLPILSTVSNQRPAKNSFSSLGLYPTFSDQQAIERFAQADAVNFPATCAESRKEIEACHRQLGVLLTLQVVPNRGHQIAALYAGDPVTVAKEAQSRYRDIWQVDCETRGNLVIATLGGDARQQTWQEFGRALTAAESVLEPGGAIAICADLSETPDRALSQLISGDNFDLIEREILRTPARHNGTALRLCRCLQEGPVFLRSNLPPAVVESLGMTPLESLEELDRLAQAQPPCIVLEEADKLLPGVSKPKRAGES